MNPRRLIYQNWIVELGHHPDFPWVEIARPYTDYNQTIINAVNRAMSKLNRDEAGLIRSFYLQGRSYREISEVTGKAMYKLESLHRNALKKLRRSLYFSLGGKYHIPSPKDSDCPLCNHPLVADINEMIRSKPDDETWKNILAKLRHDFGLTATSPQRVIGHLKYHMI